MVDVVSRAVRSRMMSGIRGKNTRPELIVRRVLFARGFRYVLHKPSLPGKPDLVLPKHRAVIFVHGCFWHCHDCALFKWPSTRAKFWRQKIRGNQKGDLRNLQALAKLGWRVLTIWECALKGRQRLDPDAVATLAEDWLLSRRKRCEISGEPLRGGTKVDRFKP